MHKNLYGYLNAFQKYICKEKKNGSHLQFQIQRGLRVSSYRIDFKLQI